MLLEEIWITHPIAKKPSANGLIKDAIAQAVADQSPLTAACTFPEAFTPNQGGQAQFFELTPLDRAVELDCRWFWLRGGLNCFSGDTLINGIPARDLARQGQPQVVETLFGSCVASPVFRKGSADLYRVETRSGKVVTVTAHHRFLSPTGWGQLQDLGLGALVAVHGSDDGDFEWEKSKDYLDRYSDCYRPCDELLPPAVVAALDKLQQLRKPVFGNSALVPCSNRLSSSRYSCPSLCHCDAQSLALPSVSAVAHHRCYKPSQGASNFRQQGIFQQTHPSVSCACCFLESYPCQELNPNVSWQALQFDRKAQIDRLQLGSRQALCRLPLELRQDTFAAYAAADDASLLQALNRLDAWQPSRSERKAQIESLQPDNYQTLYNFPLTPHPHISAYSDSVYSSSRSLFLDLVPQLNSNSYWDEITSIKYVEYGDFYDISVPFANHFLAQGIWHHNSGKSTSGAAFACSRAKLDPKARGLITANTYGQLETSTLIALVEFCRRFNIPLKPMLEDTEETARLIANRRLCRIFGAPVLVLSAEVFTGRTEDSREVGRGLQVRWIWGDELAYADESAFTTMNGRLGRGEGSLKGLGLITSSINKNNPYNYCYNLFDDPDRNDDIREQFLSIKCATYENIHADADYVQSLKSSLTAELYIIEVEGDYAAATTNRVYEQFDRRFNACDLEPQPHDRLHIGMDFNVGRMAAIVHVLEQQEPRAVDEFKHLKDTPAMIAAIKERYPEHDERGLITIYPDASGRKTSSANASVSDLALLQAAGFIVVANPANPSVRDRINSMNVAFCNATGDRRYRVNVKRCPFYTKALEQQVLVNGEPDKKHGLDDICDAGGYFIAKFMPVAYRPTQPAPVPQAAANSAKSLRQTF